MFRAALCVVAVGISVAGLGASAGQDKKPEPPAKEEKILDKTIGEWLQMLRTSENPKHRRAALIALEYGNAAKGAALVAILETAEKDKDAAVRVDAVRVVGRLGPDVRQAFKALLTALQSDKDDAVREAAATAIGAKFTKPAAEYVPDLVAALKDPHTGTRIAVAGALRNMGEAATPAVPALLDIARNPKEHTLVREAAVHVVIRYGKDSPRTLPLLIELTKDANNTIALREISLEGLKIADSGTTEAIEALSLALTDQNLRLRKAAAISLTALGPKAKASWPTVKTRVGDAKEDGSVRNHLIRLTGILAKTTPDAIPILETAAKTDESTENRLAAIEELGELGPLARGAVETLKGIAAQDGRAAVREAASKAVKQIQK